MIAGLLHEAGASDESGQHEGLAERHLAELCLWPVILH